MLSRRIVIYGAAGGRRLIHRGPHFEAPFCNYKVINGQIPFFPMNFKAKSSISDCNINRTCVGGVAEPTPPNLAAMSNRSIMNQSGRPMICCLKKFCEDFRKCPITIEGELAAVPDDVARHLFDSPVYSTPLGTPTREENQAGNFCLAPGRKLKNRKNSFPRVGVSS